MLVNNVLYTIPYKSRPTLPPICSRSAQLPLLSAHAIGRSAFSAGFLPINSLLRVIVARNESTLKWNSGMGHLMTLTDFVAKLKNTYQHSVDCFLTSMSCKRIFKQLQKEEVTDSTCLYFFLCLSPHNSSAYGPILMILFLFERGRCPGGSILHCINIGPIFCQFWLIIKTIVT